MRSSSAVTRCRLTHSWNWWKLNAILQQPIGADRSSTTSNWSVCYRCARWGRMSTRRNQMSQSVDPWTEETKGGNWSTDYVCCALKFVNRTNSGYWEDGSRRALYIILKTCMYFSERELWIHGIMKIEIRVTINVYCLILANGF